MSFSNGPTTVTNGLVLALDAADKNSYPGSGTSWRDLSGNNNTGTLTNGPTFNSGNGGSIVFDGVDDYVNLGNPSSLIITTQTTLEGWIYGTSWSSGLVFPIISRWVGNSYKLAIIGNSIPSDRGKVYLDVSGTGTGDIYIIANTVLSLNTWYHVTGVYNGTSLAVYINGNNISGTLTGTVPSSLFQGSSNVYIGFDVSNYFSGNISNVRIYNRALSATEILQNYNATKTRFGL